jgi:hypothetical protein
VAEGARLESIRRPEYSIPNVCNSLDTILSREEILSVYSRAVKDVILRPVVR